VVGTPPTVDFTFAVSPTCAKDPVQFTSQVIFTPGAEKTWIWDFGDGSPSDGNENPPHTFEDTGIIHVRLTALNDRCPAFITKDVRVFPPIAKFSYVVNCTTGDVIFTDESIVDPALMPLTYVWDFGDGSPTFPGKTPPPHNYATPGTKHVTLKITNGPCDYTYFKDVIITTEPADFSITRNPACKNEPFTLTATAANPANVRSFKWVIGVDTLPVSSPTYTWSLATVGTYDVSLVIDDLNGCRSVKKVPNYLKINGPAANFSFSGPGACKDKPYTFNDLSTPAGSISTWKFDFGDGTQQTFNGPPFTHSYGILGAYNVNLKVTDNAGCTDSIALPDQLLVTQAIAGFRADTFYCPQAPLQFADTSSGVGLTYIWSFGDGNTSTLQNPTNSYPAGDALYSVKLKITDISGCSDSVTKNNYIKIRTPKAAFQIFDTTTICPPLNTSFLFQGSDYATFQWDFGDGATSPVQSPNHFYGNFGHFIPTLTLTGPGGCSNSANATVSVYNPTASQINYGPITTACNSLNVDFNLVVPPGFPFIFSFGDGVNDSTGHTTLSHFYPRPSLNLPLLTMIDTAQGCVGYLYGNPRIDVLGAIPLFGKDKEEFCDQGIVQFKDFTTKNEPIQSFTWNFGDGTTSNAIDPPHNYTQPGLYEVRLDVTTVSNCSNSYKDTILVYRTPAPSILSRDTICVNTTEPFTGVLAQADTAIKYQWTFGNGQTAKDSISNATYTTTGDFPITLTTTNKIGCTANATKSIHVATPPTATPLQNPITIISGGSTSLAMTYTGNIANYNWLPQTRLNCTDCPIPTAHPQSTTKYTVQVTDVYGCRTSTDVTVIVVCNDLNFFVPNTFSPNGDGHNESFFVRGTGLFTVRSLTVFNRWGQIVFDKKNVAVNDPAAGWNGMFNGQKASPDVYVYIMEILCENGQVFPVKGNVTLLR
jgi:gliding motility-associated-like protein